MPLVFPPAPRVKFVTQLPRVPGFQHRSELDALTDWWTGIRPNVCVLAGPDGAGKTALVDRFLRLVTAKMEVRPGDRRESEFATPQAVFSFSLSAVPNPSGFLARLAAWLTGEDYVETAPCPSPFQVFSLLRQIPHPPESAASSLLLVLDGGERYQEIDKDGFAGGNRDKDSDSGGAITSDGLRLLVRFVAERRLPGVRLLLTARRPLPVSPSNAAAGVLHIPVGALSRADGIALLRKHDMNGFDDDLSRVADACRHHALNLNLAAHFLSEFHGNEASLAPFGGSGNGAMNLVEGRASQEQNAVIGSLHALLDAFRHRLTQEDAALWPLLERVALFRLGVTAEMLAALFVGSAKVEVSGPILSSLHGLEVSPKLQRLRDLGLLDPYPTDRFAVHPFLRDALLEKMDPGETRRSHDMVRRALETVPGGRPAIGEATENPTVLDLLEEIVHHSLASDHVREAFNAYWYRMGRFDNLGFGLGDYERGERVCRTILRALPAEGQSEETVYLQAARPALRNDLALFLDGLGRLDEAGTLHEEGIERALRDGDRTNAATALLNLSDVRVQQGRLPAALGAAGRAVALADELGDSELQRTAYALRGYVGFLLGQTDEAAADFDRAQKQQSVLDEEEDTLYSGRGVWHARYLSGLGLHEEARAVSERNKTVCLEHFGEDEPTTPQCDLVLAELAAEHGERDVAVSYLEAAERWALEHGARALLCRVAGVRTRIALIQTEPEGAATAATVLDELEDALLLARECGYELIRIDLLLDRSALRSAQGEREAAERDARAACEAAEASDCAYVWGARRARTLLES